MHWISFAVGILTAWAVIGSILIIEDMRYGKQKSTLLKIDEKFLIWLALPAYPFAFLIAFGVLAVRSIKKLINNIKDEIRWRFPKKYKPWLR